MGDPRQFDRPLRLPDWALRPPQGPPASASQPATAQPPAGDRHVWTFSAGGAIGYGWSKTKQHLGLVVLATLAYLALSAGINAVAEATASALVDTSGEGAAGMTRTALSTLVSGIVSTVLAVVLQASAVSGVLALVDGRPLSRDILLPRRHLPALLLGSLVIGVASAIGLFLLILPGIAVIVLTAFYMHFTIDRGLSAMEAMRASAAFVKPNLGPLVKLFLASILVMLAGTLALGVGLLVALPVVLIAQTYAFRVLQGQPVTH